MITSGAFMRPTASSFPLQLLLEISIWFIPCWWALTFSLLIYKGTLLPYPPTALGFEIAVTFLIWFIQYWAVKFSKRGNLTEQTGILGIGLFLMLFVFFGCLFYTRFQTYVMKLDEGFGITLMVIDALCIVLGAIAMQGFGASMVPAAQQQQQQNQGQQQQQQQQVQGQEGLINNNNQQGFNNSNQQQQQQQQFDQQQQGGGGGGNFVPGVGQPQAAGYPPQAAGGDQQQASGTFYPNNNSNALDANAAAAAAAGVGENPSRQGAPQAAPITQDQEMQPVLMSPSSGAGGEGHEKVD